jgi:TfoX/Sxy family transcriptional regulator of competence genes
MPFNEKLADRVREIIAETQTDVEEKRMFGGLCFMVNGKMCVGVESERMMIRFDPVRTEEIMEIDGVGPMDFTKRVMKGFAFVESRVLKSDKNLRRFVDMALEFNKQAKPSKKRSKT